MEDTLSHHEYILQKTERTLRSMTFFGKIYNLFTAEPSAPSSAANGAARASYSSGSASGSASTTARTNAPAKAASRGELMDGARDDSKPVFKNRLDPELAQLEATVDELKAISERMGEALDASHQQLYRIDNKTQKVTDETVQLSMKTGKMLQDSRRTAKRSMGMYTFFSADAGRFLAAEGDRLVLRDTMIDRRCVWEVFMKEEGVYGFQNCFTRKWIGISFLGYIQVASVTFGPSEHMYLDLSARESALLCPSANFGAGGWVIARGTTEEGWILLDTVTNRPTNRSGAVIFMVESVRKDQADALFAYSSPQGCK